MAFFDETDDKNKQMKTYYYWGSIYRDLNDAPRALKVFKQVLHLNEDCLPCDLFARTYNYMGPLFAHQELYDESMEANEKSAQQYGDIRKQYYANQHLFQIKMKLNDNQEAMEHYHVAYALDNSIKRITEIETVAKDKCLIQLPAY